jgi:DNA adenine methylase
VISPLVYIGGKNRAAARILPLIPKHTCYTEAFAGGAQVFFRKPRSEVEVINDLSRDVVTFFRVCQNHYQELVRYMRFMVVSRGWYDLLQGTDPDTLTDVQRAARFHYLQKTSYAGRVVKQNFRYSSSQIPNFRPDKIPEALEDTHARLLGVQIECLPYEKVLEKYDRSTTFHFLDPPYYGRTLYRFNFTPDDFRTLAARLQKIKGKFLLTLDDHPEIKKIFGMFEIRPFQMTYSSQRKPGRRYQELFISNYRLPSQSA